MRYSYSIRVQTIDVTGASYSEALIINVNDVAESPTDLNFSNTRQPLTLNPQPLTLSLFEKEEEDTLIGGEGSDTLHGGEDADLFVLGSGMGWDTIIDFEDGTDFIRLAGGSQGLDTWINFESKTMATLPGIDETLINVDDFTVVN